MTYNRTERTLPILKNPRHELMAQELAKGANATAAYIAAGYKSYTSNSSRLRRDPVVVARVEELLASGAERTVVTVQSIVEELAKIGFANMLDYVTLEPDGDAVLDLTRLTRDQAAAISEVIVAEYKGRRGAKARGMRKVKFKLYDKKAALINLGNHLGMFKDKAELEMPQFIERDKLDREV